MKEHRRKCTKCGASPSENSRTILHRFPKPGRTNSLRCELWAKYCFPLDPWNSPEFQAKLYSSHRMLCSKHFKKTYFIDDACTKLFKSAVPDEESNKMFMDHDKEPVVPGPSHVSQPLKENINILNSNQAMNGPNQIDPVEIVTVAHPSKNEVEPQNVKSRNYTKCKKHLKKVYQLQQKIKKMKNKSFINEILNNGSIKAVLKSKISPTAALLLQGEIKNFKKTAKARRWDTDSKIVALRLYKRSPTSYKLLRRMICLPAPSTLKQLLTKFKLNVGINKQIFNILKKKAMKNEKPSDSEYVLMWDEMSIKKNINYNEKEDAIEGFQDHASQGRSPEIASYALVFMITGIRKSVKQPVAFYLSAGSVTADRLAVLIKEVLKHCLDARLRISATVCDLDGVNKRAIKNLGASVEQPYITMGNQEVVTLFDTPHLLKCFRNLFLKYDIECPVSITSENGNGTGIAKWRFIQDFYDLDNTNPNFVFAPCLKQEHLNPNTKQKMKVKLAAQVLSHSVAAGMYAKISQGELPTSATTTADVIAKMDQLFDSVNAYTPDQRRGKPLATNLGNKTPHLEFFKNMKDTFKNMKFLGCRRPPPSQEGWIWTLNGIERVWKNLTSTHKDIKSLSTRRLQQDPIENLFGCIRANCGANSNPTTGQFVAGLKTAMLSNLSHIVVGNCENDENEAIIANYKTLLSQTPESIDVETENSMEGEINQRVNYDFQEALGVDNNSEIQACAYVCGFILKGLKAKIQSCEMCRKILCTDDQLPEHIFIEFKEYDNLKKSLGYASKELIFCVEKCALLINNYLQQEAYKINLKKNIKELLHSKINFNFINCLAHKESNINYLIKSVFYICMKRFCTLRNRQFAEESSKVALRRKMDILQHR